MISSFDPDTDFEAIKGVSIGIPGQTRAAFEALGHPDWAMKECLGSHEPNWTEFIVYQSLDGTQLQELFGSCIAISQSGRCLIMERLDDLTPDQVPLRKRTPVWFTDPKVSAWGAIPLSDTVKIRDYGTLALRRSLAAAPLNPSLSDAQRDSARAVMDTIRKLNPDD